MNIQELCKEIDKQYNLYTSMEGADEDSCNKLLASVSNLIESGEALFHPPAHGRGRGGKERS